jgi:hypothetical protein
VVAGGAKPKKEMVAAHLVNLAWNGLSHLEPKPTLLTREDPSRARTAPFCGLALFDLSGARGRTRAARYWE